jgi:hypothetical protein
MVAHGNELFDGGCTKAIVMKPADALMSRVLRACCEKARHRGSLSVSGSASCAHLLKNLRLALVHLAAARLGAYKSKSVVVAPIEDDYGETPRATMRRSAGTRGSRRKVAVTRDRVPHFLVVPAG